MKLLNILGAVIAAHVAVLVLAVAIPGCRSTRTAAPLAGADESTVAYPAPTRSTAPAFTSAPELADRDLNPPLAGREPAMFDPNAPAVAVGGGGGGGGRYSPTRPGSIVSTPIDDLPAQPVPAPATTPYTVKRGDNLWTLSRTHGITVRELAAANNIPADAMLREGQVLVIPGQHSAPAGGGAAATAAVSTDSPSRTYTILPGDTLGRIAGKHGITVAQLKAFNRLTSDLVRAGDKLAIPEAATVPTSEAVVPDAPAVAAAPPASADVYKHTVAPGESVNLIARRYGVKSVDITMANMIKDPSLIRAGQQLIIPGWKAPDQGTAANSAMPRGPTSPAVPPANPRAANPDATLDNIPVIDVERSTASKDEDEQPIRTLNLGGGGGGGGGGAGSESPPLFE